MTNAETGKLAGFGVRRSSFDIFMDSSTTIADLRAAMQTFVSEREWQPYHDPKNLAGSVMIEAAELLEHFQWVRSEELPALLREPGRREAITDELADVMCYVLALANVLEIDVSDAVLGKLKKNAAKYPVEQFRGKYYKPGAAPTQSNSAAAPQSSRQVSR